jgi:mannose-6-phosphate isomerase class I
MQKLKCVVQNYEWGRIGEKSKVAQLYGGEIDLNKPYAEVRVVLVLELKLFFSVVDG